METILKNNRRVLVSNLASSLNKEDILRLELISLGFQLSMLQIHDSRIPDIEFLKVLSNNTRYISRRLVDIRLIISSIISEKK